MTNDFLVFVAARTGSRVFLKRLAGAGSETVFSVVLGVTGSFVGTGSRIIIELLSHGSACLRAKGILCSLILDVCRNGLVVVGTRRIFD